MARFFPFGVIALVGGAVLAVTGCTQSVTPPTASPSPSVSVAASVTASPSPTPLTDEELLALIPARANQENFYGASQFAAFFLREYQVMFDTHDSQLFAFVSGPDCAFCSSSLESFAELEAAGGWREGGQMSVDPDLAVGGLETDGFWYLAMPITTGPVTNYGAGGETLSKSDGRTGTASLKLVWEDDGWHVIGVSLEEG